MNYGKAVLAMPPNNSLQRTALTGRR